MQKNLYFTEDITEFLLLLFKHKVKYLIVGGEAVLFHGHSRLTGDIDIFYENSDENINKLFNILLEFWNNEIPGIKEKSELKEPGIIIQFGLPPNRIDLMNQIEGVDFSEAFNNKIIINTLLNNQNAEIYYIGLKELIKNKKAMGRPKDIDDLQYLQKLSNDKTL
ncbi:MAG: DUF6036 family nucleotidyltransferase [Melioribacteraceae bacterium]